jgi:hypothetical protein
MRASKKEKDPCFLFYSQDWFTGTYGMTRAQKGCFIDLLCLQHQGVVITFDLIKKTCEGKKKDVEELLTKFVKDSDGNFYNKKMKEVMSARALYKHKQSQNASKRGATAEPPHQPNLSTRVENEDVRDNTITIASIDANHYQSLNDLFED